MSGHKQQVDPPENRPSLESLQEENARLREQVARLQQQAEEAAVLTADLTALIENTDDPILFTDQDGNIRIFNSAYARTMQAMLGLEVKPGMQPHKTVEGPEQAFWDELHRRVLSGEKFTHHFSYPDPAGRMRHFEHRFNPIFEDDSVRGFSEFTREITDRIEAEQELTRHREQLEQLVQERTVQLSGEVESHRSTSSELRASRERYRLLFEHSPLGILHCDLEGHVVKCNEKCCAILGVTPQQLIGFNLLTDSADTTVVEGFQNVLQGNTHNYEGPYTSKISGRQVHVRVVAGPICDEQGEIVGGIGIFEDITEVRRAEEELLRISRLESLGVFAGGIAHDFNNLLTAILGNMSLITNELPDAGLARECVASIEQAVGAARDLTRQLLTFARGGEPVTAPSCLRELIQDNVAFSLRGSKVKCRFHLTPDLWNAEVDAGQISQVIRNLVINACQAMPKGGVMEVMAENLVLDEVGSLPLKAGKYLSIRVRDHGPGVSEAIADKIFDPYFTTKDSGNGLGLAVCHSIIKRHGGYITLENNNGDGATFHFYLPACESTVSQNNGGMDGCVPPGMRVLVLDDQAEIRKLLARMLQQLHCRADIVSEGEQVVARCAATGPGKEAYDLLILDLTIPGGMSGLETLRRVRESGCQVPALVISGYSCDIALADATRYGFAAALAKPFSIEDLKLAMRQILS